MISKWSRTNEVRQQNQLKRFLAGFPSLYYIHQKVILREIRAFTTSGPSLRAHVDLIPLLDQSMIPKYHSDTEMYYDVLSTILNLSTDADTRKEVVQHCPRVVPFLIEALGAQNTAENRGCAAASIAELSLLHDNRDLIEEAQGVRPLIDLLELGHPLVSVEAGRAIYRLCERSEGLLETIAEGVLTALINKLEDPGLVSGVLEILLLFSSHPRFANEMVGRNVVPRLFRFVEEGHGMEEASLDILCNITSGIGEDWVEQIENLKKTNEVLVNVSKNGTCRAKNSACVLLERI